MFDALVIFGTTFILMITFVAIDIIMKALRRKSLMDEWKRDVEILKRESELNSCRPNLRVVKGGRDDA